jgi:hypothetical protein
MPAAEEAAAKHQRGCFDKTGFILNRTRKKFIYISLCFLVEVWGGRDGLTEMNVEGG